MTGPAGATGNPGTANLVSWWALDEASGTLVDSHGSYDLSDITGTLSYEQAGQQGTAVSFPDAGRAETATNFDGAVDATAFSLCVWVKYVGTAGWDLETIAGNYSIFSTDRPSVSLYKGGGGNTYAAFQVGASGTYAGAVGVAGTQFHFCNLLNEQQNFRRHRSPAPR